MYKPILIRTLKFFNKNKLPITKEELFYLSIFKPDEKIPTKENFEHRLNELIENGIVSIKNGFLFFNDKELPIIIRERNIAQKRFNQIKHRFFKNSHKLKTDVIKSVLLIKNNFLIGTTNKSQESVDIILITEAGKEYIGRFYFLTFAKRRKIRYRKLYLFNEKNLSIPKRIEWAHAISTAEVVHNKGGFDRLIADNLWIFELLQNYPMEKLKVKYRVEKKKDNNLAINKRTKILNKLSKYVCDIIYKH